MKINKTIKIIVTITIIFTISTIFIFHNNKKKEPINLNKEQISLYKKNTENFILLKPKEIDEKIKKPIYIYFGRITCSTCRAFVAELKQYSNKKIYYIDTDNDDSQLLKIRNKYNIDNVPQLIYISNNEIKKYDRNTELIDFFN